MDETTAEVGIAEGVVTDVADELGIDPTWAGLVALVMIIARALAKRIPDSKTGALGWVRRIAKIVGMYGKNRE